MAKTAERQRENRQKDDKRGGERKERECVAKFLFKDEQIVAS